MNEILAIPYVRFENAAEQRLYDAYRQIIGELDWCYAIVRDEHDGHYYSSFLPSIEDGDVNGLVHEEDQGRFLGEHAVLLLDIARDRGVLYHLRETNTIGQILDAGLYWAIDHAVNSLNADA